MARLDDTSLVIFDLLGSSSKIVFKLVQTFPSNSITSYFMQQTMVVNEIKSNPFFRSMKMDLVILCLSICSKM